LSVTTLNVFNPEKDPKFSTSLLSDVNSFSQQSWVPCWLRKS